MLRSRIIPCLLVKNQGLVKTIQFDNPKYVGDPINAVKIFNEKEADELIVLDISATIEKREPDYDMIGQLAEECRMPLCYGGGVSSSDQVLRIVQLGVEKVAISSAAVENPHLVMEAADRVGNQSVVFVLDVKKNIITRKYEVWTKNGHKKTGKCPIELSQQMEKKGAGEILINSIDNDGLMKGYDFSIVELIKKKIGVPLTILGGAGSPNDLRELIGRYGPIGAAAGSLFVFKGAYRAVLINYPNRAEKNLLIEDQSSK